jgi:hypothetical protein
MASRTRAEFNLQDQKSKASKSKIAYSAKAYVNQGLRELNLKPKEADALRAKLIPIVASRMTNDRMRTISRVQNVIASQKKAKITKATGSIG